MGAIPLGHLHDVALILNFERCWEHALEVHVHTQDDTGVWAKKWTNATMQIGMQMGMQKEAETATEMVPERVYAYLRARACRGTW